jgi:hypothetical protein
MVSLLLWYSCYHTAIFRLLHLNAMSMNLQAYQLSLPLQSLMMQLYTLVYLLGDVLPKSLPETIFVLVTLLLNILLYSQVFNSLNFIRLAVFICYCCFWVCIGGVFIFSHSLILCFQCLTFLFLFCFSYYFLM